ncbi:Shedu anti-phage system protein SduA domain-containing protein [Cyclobacterium amurskyense]|uniref:Shedu protein SduA C-terminal domain-containing protein n=1 Tax=Cyclobacterium amurskyense TaxID=320787 RepID=A0A0H4PBE1_9BACT|nr:Shedu anti-phage system protein SduA domain-containing protein [Cyclobacterium amurskyense]AKP51539.1 hypothetical protein CA2015_2117 [Cyclobacterium amurskyense]
MDEEKRIKKNHIETIQFLVNKIGKKYWLPLYLYLKEHPKLLKTFSGFLLYNEKVVFYLGKTHLAIEYFGNERVDKLKESFETSFLLHDYSLIENDFFDEIIGFSYDSSSDSFKPPLPLFLEDLIVPTNRGFDKLAELNWNFDAQNAIYFFNSNGISILKGQFGRIINGLFFDADEKGLKTRHIKWIDFIPLQYDDSGEGHDFFSINFGYYDKLVEQDAHFVYPLPSLDDFKFSKLPQVNRFIELTGNSRTSEPEITKFLEQKENKFILTMGFLAKEIHGQLKCEWQSEKRDPIIPDFFVVRPNGFADIVEFKLPDLDGRPVVGKNNRETLSAKFNSYISQTRNYKTYFEDPNNRKWMLEKYGVKVQKPKRILVIGRRWDFATDEWREIISDYRDIDIMTFDDLVDGVVAQFYM